MFIAITQRMGATVPIHIKLLYVIMTLILIKIAFFSLTRTSITVICPMQCKINLLWTYEVSKFQVIGTKMSTHVIQA